MLARLLCVLSLFNVALGQSTFGFTRLPDAPFYGRVDSHIYQTVAPLAFTNNLVDVGVAPIGSWVIYGTQPDVWLSSDKGATWRILAGLAGHGLPDNADHSFDANGSGNMGCGHRSKFNRFYWMGESNQNAGNEQANTQFSNYYSTDGSEWTEIMEQASNDAMTSRVATRWGICTVGLNEHVYSVGGQDTWESVDLGVSWQRVPSTTHFQTRQSHGGDMYTPMEDITKEYIVILGGRGWSTESEYGEMYNDVWMTSDYARTWRRQTAAAPWRTRENAQVAVTKQGMIVMNGGALCSGYGCETEGPWANQGWLSDTWVSFDHGVNWQRLAATTNALFAQASSVFDDDGFWYVWAGQTGSANNTDYAWTSYGFKSSHSLYQIANWGPPMGINVPANFGRVFEPVGLCPAKNITLLPRGEYVAPATPDSSSSSSSLGGGAIAGIVIGSVVGALLICLFLYFMCCANRGSTSKSNKFHDVENSTTDVEMH